MFQRLNNSPLDTTNIFNTFNEAEQYTLNNPTAYIGQMIYIKENKCIYYIDEEKQLKDICVFSEEAIKLLLDFIYIEFKGGVSDKAIEEFKKLFEDVYDMPISDYYSEPWNPELYNEYQIAIKTSYLLNDDEYKIHTDGEYSIENITAIRDGVEGYYKVYTFKKLPTFLTFGGIRYLAEVIHMCDTSKLVTMIGMFMGSGVSAINGLEVWDTSNVTDMSHMFQGCGMTEINISNWNTDKVINMNGMFKDCYNLKRIDMYN
jgi:surface protein